jgi:hypothetical protein
MAQTEKELIIESIKEIIKEHGSFTTADLQAESSPIIKSIGKNIVQLAERFNLNGVEATSNVHDNEVEKEDITYEDL